MPPQSAPVDVEQPLLEVWARFFTVNAERVLYKDEQVVAFWDRSPAAAMYVFRWTGWGCVLGGVQAVGSQAGDCRLAVGAVVRRGTVHRWATMVRYGVE